MRLVQNFGVANTTTNGACAASESATEYRSSAVSGGVLVVSSRKFPCVLAIVGVFDAIAFEPTAGAFGCSGTSMRNAACTGLAPSVSIPSTYFPALGTWKCDDVELRDVAGVDVDAGDADGLAARRLVTASGLASVEVATDTRTCGAIHRRALVVDQQEREADRARRVVLGSRDDADVRPRPGENRRDRVRPAESSPGAAPVRRAATACGEHGSGRDERRCDPSSAHPSSLAGRIQKAPQSS